jgi:hypothetical protein
LKDAGVEVDIGLEPCARVRETGIDSGQPIREAFCVTLDECPPQLCLASEVIVEAGSGDAKLGRDVCVAEPVESAVSGSRNREEDGYRATDTAQDLSDPG